MDLTDLFITFSRWPCIFRNVWSKVNPFNANTNSLSFANAYYQQFVVLSETTECSKVFAARSNDFFTRPNAILKISKSFNLAWSTVNPLIRSYYVKHLSFILVFKLFCYIISFLQFIKWISICYIVYNDCDMWIFVIHRRQWMISFLTSCIPHLDLSCHHDYTTNI